MSSNNCGEPNKTTGQFHSLKGTAVEAVGNATGSDSWSNAGKKEHTEGEAEYKGAQAKGYVEGGIDRVMGMKDSIVGSITGDKTQESSGDAKKVKGKTQQEMNS